MFDPQTAQNIESTFDFSGTTQTRAFQIFDSLEFFFEKHTETREQVLELLCGLLENLAAALRFRLR